VAHAFIIGAVHEARERREAATHQKFEVAELACCKVPGRAFFRMSLQFRGNIGRHLQLDKFSPVRGNKMTGRSGQFGDPPMRRSSFS